MSQAQLLQTFRGTIEEVLSHTSEIPAGAMLELRVYEPGVTIDDDFEGKTFGDLFGDLLGAVDAGPNDLARSPEKYMQDFGDTANRRIP